MKKNLELERYLYKEWEKSRDRSENHNEAASRAIAATGNPKDGEYYERLAELEWAHSVDILEIIYDFEKERAS